MNEDFRYIVAIADTGSISKAARSASISQPGLSQRLKRLEAQLGCELFERGPQSLQVTPAGEVYIKYARRALAAEYSMRREVTSVAARRRRRLRIGVSMARANALLGNPIVSFYEAHRGCTVELREMSTIEQLHDLFLGDEIDFAVLTPIAPDPAHYDSEMLCRERLVAVMSSELTVPQVKEASSGCISLGQLEGVPFVLPTCGEYFDPLISRIIDLSRAQLDIVVRDCSTDLALSMVRGGLGVSIVPSTSLKGWPSLRAYDLEGVSAGNVLRYIRRNDRPRSDEEELFVNIVRECLAAS